MNNIQSNIIDNNEDKQTIHEKIIREKQNNKGN